MAQKVSDAGATRGPVLGSVQEVVVVFERAPESLDEHVVDRSSHPTNGDPHVNVGQHRGEGVGAELRASQSAAVSSVGRLIDSDRGN